MIKSYPERTRERVRRLQEYMRSHVLDDGKFVCRHFSACRASRSDFPFYEGQLSYVGRHYDLEIDSKPIRVVIAAQEYGTGERGCGLTQRSQMVADSAWAGFKGRNLHMKGTTSKLRLLLGRKPGIDPEGECLLDGHIFDGFALVNYLLCTSLSEPRGPYDGGAGKGNSSSTMQRNCGGHFLRTLEILEPTLVVIQGQGVRRWLAGALRLPTQGPVIEQVEIGGGQVTLATFDHPSAGGKSGYWGNSPNSRYLREVVTPVMHKIACNL